MKESEIYRRKLYDEEEKPHYEAHKLSIQRRVVEHLMKQPPETLPNEREKNWLGYRLVEKTESLEEHSLYTDLQHDGFGKPIPQTKELYHDFGACTPDERGAAALKGIDEYISRSEVLMKEKGSDEYKPELVAEHMRNVNRKDAVQHAQEVQESLKYIETATRAELRRESPIIPKGADDLKSFKEKLSNEAWHYTSIEEHRNLSEEAKYVIKMNPDATPSQTKQFIDDIYHATGSPTPDEINKSVNNAVSLYQKERFIEVNEHRTSMKQRCLDELRENPPHIPNPERVHPRAFAASLVEETVTPYEKDLYAGIQAKFDKLPFEDRLKGYEPYQPGQKEPIDETPLEIETYHANGICTPTERREAALDALQEHKKERAHVHPRTVEETKLPGGSTFTRYEVSQADLARSDYPGPTPADKRIYALLDKGQAPRAGSEIGNRYSHIVDEFGERRGLLRKKCIPKDFVEKLQQREKVSLDKFIAQNYGAPVDPPVGSKGQGQYVASVTTHATTHHIIQDGPSGRVVVVDGRNQPELNELKPGARVQISAKQGPENRVSLAVQTQQRKVSNDFEL